MPCAKYYFPSVHNVQQFGYWCPFQMHAFVCSCKQVYLSCQCTLERFNLQANIAVMSTGAAPVCLCLRTQKGDEYLELSSAEALSSWRTLRACLLAIMWLQI